MQVVDSADDRFDAFAFKQSALLRTRIWRRQSLRNRYRQVVSSQKTSPVEVLTSLLLRWGYVFQFCLSVSPSVRLINQLRHARPTAVTLGWELSRLCWVPNLKRIFFSLFLWVLANRNLQWRFRFFSTRSFLPIFLPFCLLFPFTLFLSCLPFSIPVSLNLIKGLGKRYSFPEGPCGVQPPRILRSNKYERYYMTRKAPACLLTVLCHYGKPRVRINIHQYAAPIECSVTHGAATSLAAAG